jgi:hypothetical protein
MSNDDSPFAFRRESPAPPDSPIDRAIDRAVRKMMQIDPPAGLRRRVMSRIEAPAPRRTIFLPAFAAAAAVLAVLVLGIVAARNGRVSPITVEAPAVAVVVERAPAADAPVAPAPASVETSSPRTRPVVTPRRAGFHREPIPMARVDDIFGTRTTAIAAAADPTADAIWTGPADSAGGAAAAPAAIVVDPVGVAPIETAPIVIAPLFVGRPVNAPGAPK